jgi:hypothetical protein
MLGNFGLMLRGVGLAFRDPTAPDSKQYGSYSSYHKGNIAKSRAEGFRVAANFVPKSPSQDAPNQNYTGCSS